MAYILEFTVHGLGGRRKPVHHSLNRHVNVFWGLNGSGKTSLLKILHSALANDTTSLIRVPFRSADVTLYSADSDTTIVRTIDLAAEVHLPRDQVSLFEDSDPASRERQIRYWLTQDLKPMEWRSALLKGAPRKTLDIRFRHSYLPISRIAEAVPQGSVAATLPRGRREAIDDAYFDLVFAEQVQRRWQRYNASALDRITDVQQQGLAEILSVLFSGASSRVTLTKAPKQAEEAYELISNFLRRQNIRARFDLASFSQRYNQDSNLQLVVSRIQDVTREVNLALHPQQNFQKLIDDFYSGSKSVALSQKGIQVHAGKEPIPLESLSSGEKQLMQILLETLAAEEDSVIVDEPELSMHVDWQHRIVDAMMLVNPDCQLILATHSPEVMAPLPDEYIFEL